jgi:hypothetical protein
MSEELKACPFCGSKGLYSKSQFSEWANCSKPREHESYCPLSTHYIQKEYWQNRPIEDALRAERDELLEALERLLPYLPDENDVLNHAAVNDGRASDYDVAALHARAAISKVKGE